MPSPFPGMDPYLEHPAGWLGIQSRLLNAIAYQLAPKLDPNYYVGVEERVSVVLPSENENGSSSRRFFVPDLAVSETGEMAPQRRGGVMTAARPLTVRLPQPEDVRELFLEFRDLRSGGEVVTVLELLSPTNKEWGEHRSAYLHKRITVLKSPVNLVEIDLLRAGPRMPVLDAPSDYDYSVLVSRSPEREKADFYPFTIRQAIPVFPLPLKPGEEEPAVDLRQALDEIYDRGRLHLITRYESDPNPALSPADQGWAREILDRTLTP